MAFPTTPIEGQIYKKMIYEAGKWKNLSGICLASKFKMNAPYIHTAGIWEKMPFNTVEYGNLPIMFNASLNRFIPFNKGIYRISITGYSTSNGAGAGPRYAIGIYKNNTNIGFTGGNINLTADSPLVGYTGLVSVNGTTDYFEIWSYCAISAVFGGGSSVSEGHEMMLYIEYLGEQ